MVTSLERDLRVMFEQHAINDARISSAPSTPAFTSAPSSQYDTHKASSCPRHIETDLERIFREQFEQKSITRMAKLRDDLGKRSAALADNTSSSRPVMNVNQHARVPPSPMELLVHLLVVFGFALFVGVVGHFKNEAHLVGRFFVDFVAAVLGTLWDIAHFPFQLWTDPSHQSLCMALKITEALSYSCVFSTDANVLFFELLYSMMNDRLERVEDRWQIGAQTKTIVESFCFNVKTAVDGYREVYDKMVPLLQHDPMEEQTDSVGGYPRLDQAG